MSETTGPKLTQPPIIPTGGSPICGKDSKDLRQQIVETNRQIVETNRSLSQRIDETNKCIESRFAWLITIMVALTGILIAVIKL